MKNSPTKKTAFKILRQKAEDFLKRKPKLSYPVLSDADALKLHHEFEIQQIELDMQNEELLGAQIAAQDAIDLYDFAPDGCFTLSKAGEIMGLNQSGAILLHGDKVSLKGRMFHLYLSKESKPIFNNFLQNIFNYKVKEICDIVLLTKGYSPIYLNLTGIPGKDQEICFVTSIDTTKQKLNEESIQHEKELFLDLVNNQPSGIYRIRVFERGKWWNKSWSSTENPPYQMEFASDRFCEILGITRVEFDSKPSIIADLIHPEDRQDFVIKNEEANNAVITFKWEGRLVVHEKVIWIHLESVPRSLANGEIMWTGILYDISDQKRGIEALKDSENKYRELVDNSPDAIGIYSEGKIVFVNNECLRLMAASSAEELLGKSVIEFIHPDFRAFAMERMQKVTIDRNIQPLTEEKFIRLDGTTVDVEVKSMPITFQQRQAVQLIVRDNTAQKKAENELKANREEFKDLFDHAPIGYHEIDQEGRIVRINQTELNMLGYSLEELTGKFIWEISANASESKKVTKEKLEGLNTSTKSFGKEFLRKDGSTFPVLIQDKILRNNDGKISGIRSTIQDITERKKSENEINKSREDFKDLFDNAPVGYHEIDSEGRIVRMNQTELSMLDYKSDEIIGQYIWKIAHNETQTKQRVKAKLKGQELSLSSFETTLVSKSGLRHSILILDKILRDKNGTITGLRSTIQDISEIKKAEKNLLLSEEKFRNIFENSVAGKSTTSIEGEMSVNRAFCQIVGYSNEELSHLKWAEFTHPDDIEFNKNEIKSMLKGEKTSAHWEKRYIHKNGNIVWVDISTSLQRDIEGNPLNFITEIYEITERKQTEKALRESEELYRNLVLRIPDGVYKSTPDGKFIDVNPAMVKMLGYESKKEMMDIEIKSQLYIDSADRDYKELNDQNEEMSVFPLKKKDGSEIWIEDHGWYNMDLNGTIISNEGVLRDITDRKLAQDALRERESMLKRTLIESTGLIDVTSEEIDYEKISDTILEISGAKYVSFNIFDENGLDLTTVAVSGVKEHILNSSSYFGFEVINKKWKFDPVRDEKTKDKAITRFDSLKELSSFSIPKSISSLINKIFNLGEAFVVKITKNNKTIGDFTLIYSKGETLKNSELVLLFANQVALFIDRNKTVNDMRINEEKYRYLFDNNPQPMYIHDLDTLEILEVNLAAIKHYGYSKEEFLQMTLKDIRPPDDIQKLLIDVQDKRKTFKPAGVWRHKKKNGEIIFVDITTVTVISNGKNVRHVMVQDITERKRAEDALKESVSLLNATIESTADGILVVDITGKITLLNQKFIEMWKIPNEIIENKDDEIMLNSVLCQVKKQDEFRNKVQFLYQHPEQTGIDQIHLLDGRVFDRYSFPHKIGEKIVGRVWSFRDITISKIAQESLRMSEEKFRSITEQIDDFISITDGNGIITYGSPASREFFQYEPEEICGHHFMEFIHEESLPIAIEAFRAGNVERKKAIDIEMKLKRKDGSIFFGELNGSDFMNGDQRGSLVILHDITKRKQTLELLKNSEEKFRSIAEQINELITITDDAGIIQYASPASLSLFKMEPSEMVGHNFNEFLDASSVEKAVQTFQKDLLERKNTVNLELTMKQKNGTLFYGEINGSNYMLGKDQTVKLVVIRDISDRKKSQDALEEKMNELMRFHNLTVDREMTMIELKKEINELLNKSGQKEKYKIVQ